MDLPADTFVFGLTLSEVFYFGILFLTIIAIIYGPIKAVKVTRSMDAEREKRQRRLDVFRTLMQTRQARLTPHHVGALNLIEIEFHEEQSVIDPYRVYIRALNAPLPPADDREGQARYSSEREDLLLDLLQAMGQTLNYKFDKHELRRFAYSPVGWLDDELRSRRLNHLLIEVFEGVRPLPISQFRGSEGGPFPPPPGEGA